MFTLFIKFKHFTLWAKFTKFSEFTNKKAFFMSFF